MSLLSCVIVSCANVSDHDLAGFEQPKIVNGLPTQDYPSVGALLYFGDFACSGTLIDCQTVLTAQHCVAERDERGFSVFFQHAGFFKVREIATPPSEGFPEADIAVLTLDHPVVGIEPIALSDVDSTTLGRFDATIVGYGATAEDAREGKIKREGQVEAHICNRPPIPDEPFLCWDYDHAIGVPGEDSTLCFGDSGGSLFADLGAGRVLLGVISGATRICNPGGVGFGADAFYWRDFIEQHRFRSSVHACGPLVPVEQDGTIVRRRSGVFTDGDRAHQYRFSIGPNKELLRLSVNGDVQLDIYVKHGLGASPIDQDFWFSTFGSTFGDHELEAPLGGVWSIYVKPFFENGQYQLTITALALRQDCDDECLLYERGDCDEDGFITVTDALCSLQCAIGVTPEDVSCGDHVDYDCNGKITATDALQLLREVSGLPTQTQCGLK